MSRNELRPLFLSVPFSCLTGEHPLYVEGIGWEAAANIRTGVRISTIGLPVCDSARSGHNVAFKYADSGAPGSLTSTAVVETNDVKWMTVESIDAATEFVTVYNFRIADWHTYFVGRDEWGFGLWVHNANYRIAEDGTGAAYIYLEGKADPIKFSSRADADAWAKTIGHTPYKVSPTPDRPFPGTKLVDIRKIRPDPSVPRDGADAGKLRKHGFFNWNNYQPFYVDHVRGTYYYQNGMTLVENAMRHDVTHLPVFISSGS